ncbi:ABC transporter ATP-binding protein [Acidicapsa ligni]|uniref:ABC transporter ATP-binding protein n=1 Tax=Acidicapsa ligni TaxID=542300 RepID=UPI0021E09234|nr:ABC transporter ATP-binding protein [Acidicapsa ligni]
MILSVCLVLMLIGQLARFAVPYCTTVLIDKVIGQHRGDLLHRIILVVVLATAIQAVCAYTLTQKLSRASWNLITDLRIEVQRHISHLPVAFYDVNRAGSLVSRIMSDVEGIRNLIGTGLIDFAGGLLMALIAFIYALHINVKLTLLTVSFMAAFALVQRKVFGIIRPIARERGEINAEVTGRLTESLNGVRVIKSYRAENRESEVFARGANRLLANVMRAVNKTSFTSMMSTGVVGLIAATIMFMGTREIYAGKMTLGTYVAFTMLLVYMVSPVTQVVSIGTQISEAIAGLDRTQEILREAEEDDDPDRTVAIRPQDIRGHVEFRDVRFAYEKGKTVLHGISFNAAPGTVTALVGSSGSGKSTIIGMVCAFNKPDEGTILVDGLDLSTLQLEGFRNSLGVVLQESFLFEGTILENLAFARPDASHEEIMRAASIARVDEFAVRLPGGFNTIVGERGVKLSGGQRQRVSIARAILANPRILILDEATSSLDSESESLIQEGLKYLVEGRTTFVIAHRLSTIRSADQILVIENGSVAECGNHHDLYALRGRYYDLYTRQHSLESNLFLAPGEGDKLPETDTWEDSATNDAPIQGLAQKQT